MCLVSSTVVGYVLALRMRPGEGEKVGHIPSKVLNIVPKIEVHDQHSAVSVMNASIVAVKMD